MADEFVTLRQSVQGTLPERIRAALDGYERFTADQPPADAKGFAAWHAAAKAALAHIELLVKLARWAEGGGGDKEDDIERVLAQARQAMDQYDDDGEDDP